MQLKRSEYYSDYEMQPTWSVHCSEADMGLENDSETEIWLTFTLKASIC